MAENEKDAAKQPDKPEAPKEKRPASKSKTGEAKSEKKSEAAKPRAASRKKAAGDGAEAKAPRRRSTTAKKPAAAKSGSEAEPEGEATKPKPAAKRRSPRSGGTAAKPAARRRGAPESRSETPRPAAQRPVVRAKAKYVRSSARKARMVMEHVRGKSVDDARAMLQHSPRGVARDLERLLASAIANAENNHQLVGDDLYVKEIYADEGPTLKRYRPRAQGRVYRVRKRTSHLSVALSTKE